LKRELILPHRIARLAAENPDRPFVCNVAGRTLSYGGFHEAALIWANALKRLGVDAGDTVVTMLPGDIDAHLAWLACSWLGAIEVPVNTMNRGRLLEYVIADSNARLAVMDARYLKQFAEVAGRLEKVDTVVCVNGVGEPAALPMTVRPLEEVRAGLGPAQGLSGPEAHDISAIIYTSGTTGPSKGVLVPWAEMYQFPSSSPPDSLDENGCYYAPVPTFHVGGKGVFYMAALAGARIVMREVFSASEFLADVRRFGCTSTGLIGGMAQFLMAQPERPDDADNPLSIVQVAPLFAGIDAFEQRFGVEAYTGYGMTEIGAPLYMTKQERRDWRSCGRARPGYELRIVDEHDRQMAPGTAGELIVRTDEPWLLNAGYHGKPRETAEAWRNGWFHTGDAFRVDEDGYYYFVDRFKDAMRRKGENISSFEVEAYVREHPGIAEVAAIGVPSGYGVGEDDVKVVVVPRPGSEMTPRALLDFLEPRMPRFMFPRFVEFVEALPKTPTQRVRKVELRENPLNPNTWDRERGAYLK
jgi:crotonobetaine/carnitine-CoA ligase